jgi:hypothetical protein
MMLLSCLWKTFGVRDIAGREQRFNIGTNLSLLDYACFLREEQAIWKTDFVDLKNYKLIEKAKYRADLIMASEQGGRCSILQSRVAQD